MSVISKAEGVDIMLQKDLEIGVEYVLSLPEEVRHVLGIPEESVLATCMRENNGPSGRPGLLVPCIWGMHFFTLEVLGPETRWEKIDT